MSASFPGVRWLVPLRITDGVAYGKVEIDLSRIILNWTEPPDLGTILSMRAEDMEGVYWHFKAMITQITEHQDGHTVIQLQTTNDRVQKDVTCPATPN